MDFRPRFSVAFPLEICCADNASKVAMAFSTRLISRCKSAIRAGMFTGIDACEELIPQYTV